MNAMPHVDELLGAATLARAGWLAALALQPASSGVAGRDDQPAHATAPTAACAPLVPDASPAMVVRPFDKASNLRTSSTGARSRLLFATLS
jgi:hypothetical protein